MIKIREKSLFIEFMGDSSMIRVLNYLLTERELDFSITDLADNSNIGRATLYRIWENLIKITIPPITVMITITHKRGINAPAPNCCSTGLRAPTKITPNTPDIIIENNSLIVSMVISLLQRILL